MDSKRRMQRMRRTLFARATLRFSYNYLYERSDRTKYLDVLTLLWVYVVLFFSNWRRSDALGHYVDRSVCLFFSQFFALLGATFNVQTYYGSFIRAVKIFRRS